MANPILNNMQNNDNAYAIEGEPMTINGSINKTFLLLAFTFLSACYTWGLAMSGFSDKAQMLTTGGAIIGFILAMVIIFSRKALNIFTPMYAIAEGFFIGGVSAVYAANYAGIVTQAVLATFAVLAVMLILFQSGTIKCDDKFRSVILTATLSVAAIYIIQIIASLFGRGIPQIFTSSPIGIGFSVVVVLIAALNLIIDFDFIEKGAENMLPKKYEWYGAFGLMVSLIWLYIEILRLIAKTQNRN